MRRRSQQLFNWIAPLLVLRALVPVGFMPAVAQGSLGFVFCEPGALVAAHGMQHAPGTERHAGTHSHDVRVCPYALSGAPVLAYAAAAEVLALAALVRADSSSAPDFPHAKPLRYSAPRGPPSYA
jgi:Protein of unknown function (DUF2946)